MYPALIFGFYTKCSNLRNNPRMSHHFSNSNTRAQFSADFTSGVKSKVPTILTHCTVKFVQGAAHKTWHKITVRSYKQSFRGKCLKRVLITDHFWDGNFKRGPPVPYLVIFLIKIFADKLRIVPCKGLITAPYSENSPLIVKSTSLIIFEKFRSFLRNGRLVNWYQIFSPVNYRRWGNSCFCDRYRFRNLPVFIWSCIILEIILDYEFV